MFVRTGTNLKPVNIQDKFTQRALLDSQRERAHMTSATVGRFLGTRASNGPDFSSTLITFPDLHLIFDKTPGVQSGSAEPSFNLVSRRLDSLSATLNAALTEATESALKKKMLAKLEEKKKQENLKNQTNTQTLTSQKAVEQPLKIQNSHFGVMYQLYCDLQTAKFILGFAHEVDLTVNHFRAHGVPLRQSATFFISIKLWKRPKI